MPKKSDVVKLKSNNEIAGDLEKKRAFIFIVIGAIAIGVLIVQKILY